MSTQWGRIADDGTVYLRTADGERSIGSWQAGPPEEGLAFFTRRYDALAADVALLEGRVASQSADPKAVAAAASRLRTGLDDAAALGDLEARRERLDAVLTRCDDRLAARTQQRQAAAAAAAE